MPKIEVLGNKIMILLPDTVFQKSLKIRVFAAAGKHRESTLQAVKFISDRIEKFASKRINDFVP